MGISDDEEKFDFETSLSQETCPDEFESNTTIRDTSANSSPTSSPMMAVELLSSDTTFAQRRSNPKRQNFRVFVYCSCVNAVVTQTDRHTKKNSTQSVNLALQSHFQKEWKVDIESELASHRDNGTWTFVDAPDRGRSIISAMWGFRVNYTIVMDPWKNSKRGVHAGTLKTPVPTSTKHTHL